MSEGKKKIMVISPSSFPGTTGDTANYAELLFALGRRGMGTVLICPPHRQARTFDGELAERGMRVLRIPFNPPRLLDVAERGIGMSSALRLLTFYLVEILTVLWAFTMYSVQRCIIRHSILTLPLAPLLGVLRIKSVADGEVVSHSLRDALTVPMYWIRILSWIESRVLGSYSLFRVSTKAEVTRMIELGFHPSQVILAPVGVDLSRVPVYDLREIAPATFGFFGTIERWQGIDLLIRGFVKVVEKESLAKLHVIGDGSMKDELRAITEKLGIRGNVFFWDAVPRHVLWKEYFRMFRVTVIPRPEQRVPVTPIKLAESLASGKPVIATAVEGIREMVGGGVLLVRQGDVDDLAQAMISLCNDDHLLLEMSRLALDSAKQFDVDAQAGRVLEALESCR